MELAVLKGTEKQINWAKAIRKDRLKVWQAADSDGFQTVESLLCKQIVSSWWIANKGKNLEEVCRQLEGGAKPQTPIASGTTASKKAPSVGVKAASIGLGDGDLWETVVTATGFSRSGPTRDMVTGDVVKDASLPF